MYHGNMGQPFIDIWNGQASIAKEVWKTDSKGRFGGYSVYCTNANELMKEILNEIDRQGGAINMSGRMYCPEELATKAIWPEE